MIQDLTAMFSVAQPITATTASTNVIDLRATGTVYGAAAPLTRDIGKGMSVPLRCIATESFNNLTSLRIDIQTDTTAAFSAPKTVFQSPAYTLAELQTSARYLLPDSVPVGANQQYIRLFFTLVGTAPTTGKITAGVTMGNQTNGDL